MKISAVWIVKNEEKKIATSIESVRGIADEIIVVDTGSTDNTVQVAKDAGAQIEHFAWVDDFAAAKNHALAKASHDLIIFLDADEYFVPALVKVDKKKFEDFYKRDDVDAVRFSASDFDADTDSKLGEGRGTTRMIKNHRGIRFIGAIHEEMRKKGDVSLNILSMMNVVIHHTGYRLSGDAKKNARNITTLEKIINQEDQKNFAARNHFYLMREYHNSGESDKAKKHLFWLLQHEKETALFMQVYREVGGTAVRVGLLLSETFIDEIDGDRVKKVFVDTHITEEGRTALSCVLELAHNYCFERDEQRLLKEIDDCVAKADVAAQDKDQLGLDDYRRVKIGLMHHAAVACWRRGQKEKAFTYITFALQELEFLGDHSVLSLFLRCVKGLPATDVILFLNKMVDTAREDVLTALVAGTQYEGNKDVFAYYVNKLVQRGEAKKSDVWFLLIVMGNAKEAVKQALQAADNTDEETIARILFLASVCSGKALYKNTEVDLGEYTAFLTAFFEGTAQEKLDVNVVLHNYQQVAFAAGRGVANKLVGILSSQYGKNMALVAQMDYYMGAGLYAAFFKECSVNYGALVDSTIPVNLAVLAEFAVMAGDYKLAYEMLQICMQHSEVSRDFFVVLQLLAERAQGDVQKQAVRLKDMCHPLYRMQRESRMRENADVANRHGDTKKQRKELAGMKEKGFDSWTLSSTKLFFKGQVAVLKQAADRHLKNEEYYRAAYIYGCLLGRKGMFVAVCEKLQQIFEKVGNTALTAVFEKRTQRAENVLQADFEELVGEIEGVANQAKLIENMKTAFGSRSDEVRKLTEDYMRRFDFWGALDSTKGVWDLLENRAHMLGKHLEDFKWLFGRLKGYQSKFTLLAYLKNMYTFDTVMLGDAADITNKEYFVPDIFKCGRGEVLVDVGAYTGDSLNNYADVYGLGNHKQIYCYEMDPVSFEKLTKSVFGLLNVQCRQKAVADKAGFIEVAMNEGDHSASSMEKQGETKVQMVTLDEDIEEPITFLKMDIEGAEQAAIKGAAKHIANDKPKLALSVYHNNEDVWKIPRMIEEICPGYTFYFNYQGGNIFPSELSLLAVHPEGANTLLGTEYAKGEFVRPMAIGALAVGGETKE